jgi:hypothetical protein
MTDVLYVNADWSALVPAGSPDAAFGITPKDAQRRGLVAASEPLDELKVLMSANLLPAQEDHMAEAKEAPKPADKSMTKPKTK